MKKICFLLCIALFLVMSVSVSQADETIWFPLWQHGWGMSSVFGFTNVGFLDATVTIEFYAQDGLQVMSRTGTIGGGGAWWLATYESWYTAGDVLGFGKIHIVSTEANIVPIGFCCGSAFNGYVILSDNSPRGL